MSLDQNLTENQKKNLETTAKAIDTSLLEAIDSGVIGANGSNLVTNGFLSITGTGVDFAVSNKGAIDILDASKIGKGARITISKLGPTASLSIEFSKIIDGNPATQASYGYISAVVAKEILFYLELSQGFRNMAAKNPYGFVINVAIDVAVVPALGAFIDWVASDGLNDASSTPTFNNPTDRYYYYYDAVENSSYSYTNTLPVNWTQLDNIETPSAAANAEQVIAKTEQVFPTAKPEKIILIEPTKKGEYFVKNSLDKLTIRNSVDAISSESFVTSNILIKVGEELDLGTHGRYTVKPGDTIWGLAFNTFSEMTVKEIVQLNTWLIDDGRVIFKDGIAYVQTDKILNEGGGTNHTLYGDANAENILIDHNGGDDKLYGGSKNDHIEGGKGFDTLQGGVGHDVLLGDNDSDVLYGGEGQDTLIGGDDNASDALFGGSGEDVLLGGGGDDTLAGGDASNLYADKELDYLAGGVGHDIYYVSHQDIINDADSTGFIMFNDKAINGKKTKVDEYTYEDANFISSEKAVA